MLSGTALGSAQLANSLGGAYLQAKAARSQGQFQQQVGNMNATAANRSAQDAVDRGNVKAQERDDQTRQQVGTDRADMAAQGVDANSEVAGNATSQAQNVGAADVSAIKTNAWREAWGYQSASINDTLQGKTADIASQNVARNTMITGATTGLSSGLRDYMMVNNYRQGGKT